MITGADLLTYVDLGPDRMSEVNDLAQSVVELFESKTGRLWSYRTGHVELFTVDDRYSTRSLWTRLVPITTAVVREWPLQSNATADDARNLDANEFRLVKSNGRIDLIRSEPWLGFDVQVTMTGGYAAPPTTLIKRALIVQAQFEIAILKQESIAATSHSVNRSSTSFRDPDMHPFFAQVVADNTRHV